MEQINEVVTPGMVELQSGEMCPIWNAIEINGDGGDTYYDLAGNAGNYSKYGGEYYDDDGLEYHDLVTLHNGKISHKDDAVWVESEGEHYDSDDVILVYTGRHQEYFPESDSDDFYEYGGNYYDMDGLEYHNLVILHDGDVCHRDNACWVEDMGEYYDEDDCYYWESDNEYHLSPEPESGLASYHDLSRKDESNGARFCVGVEIEKEDSDVREWLEDNREDLYDDYGFCAEKDSSLDSDTGFELVSPKLPLGVDTIKYFEPVKKAVNADYSDSCGGHIHFSERGKSGIETYNEFSPLVPLLFALYPKRRTSTYCGAKKAKEMVSCSEKFQAVRLFSDRIEFRIFPAVKHMENLQWRLELLDLWASHKPGYAKVMKLLKNRRSWLYVHLAKVCDATQKHSQYIDQLAYFLDVERAKVTANRVNQLAKGEK